MSADVEITCREVVELLSDFLDDELSAWQRARVETHLAGCAGCTMILDELRETVRLTGRLTEEDLTREQGATLLEAFRDWRAGG
ncbi:MAG TPA: zf-HC2 domain-containing protein [Actinomycetota bacterium]|nr:zf-HC2 domain-containing protein [Actinomycetota bacterium]